MQTLVRRWDVSRSLPKRAAMQLPPRTPAKTAAAGAQAQDVKCEKDCSAFNESLPSPLEFWDMHQRQSVLRKGQMRRGRLDGVVA